MKKLLRRIQSDTVIKDAINDGTRFYAVSEDQLKDAFRTESNNIIRYIINRDGVNAFDLDRALFGSAVFDDVLYICDTDGKQILVNGKEIDPEDALDTYGVEELEDYIEDADDKIIKRKLTFYELKHMNLDNLAKEMIENNFGFTELVRNAEELGLLDNVF